MTSPHPLQYAESVPASTAGGMLPEEQNLFEAYGATSQQRAASSPRDAELFMEMLYTMEPVERADSAGTDVSASSTSCGEEARGRASGSESEEAKPRRPYSYAAPDAATEAACRDAAMLAAKLCRTPIAWISLIDRDCRWLTAAGGVDVQEIPRDIAFSTYAILTPDAVTVVPDLREDVRFATHPRVAGRGGFRFYAAAPLVSEEGHSLGALGVLDREPRRMSEDERTAFAALARLATTQLTVLLHNQPSNASFLARKQPEQILPQSVDRFRRAWEEAPVGLALVGMEGSWLEVNRAARQILGAREDELVGCPLTAHVYSADLADLHRGFARLREGAIESCLSEVRLLSQGAGMHSVSVSASLLRDEATGEPLHYILEMTEVTSRRNLERERDRLLQEERAARAAAEAAHQGSVFLVEGGRAVAAAGLEHEVILATAAEHAVPFLGDFCLVELGDADGEPVRIFSPSGDPLWPGFADSIRTLTPAVYDQEPLAGAYHLSDPVALPGLLARTPGDVQTLRDLRLQGAIIAPIRVGEATFGHLLLLDAPGSERRCASERVVLAEGFGARVGLSIKKAQLYREATAAIAMRDKILDIVAHDLRNPVTAITLAAEMFGRNRGDSTMAGFTIDMIQEATRRLERLIMNLLDSRSIERGHLTIDCAAHDLSALLKNLEEATAPLAKRYSIDLRFQLEQELPTAIIDPDCIWQVLTNLLENAIKFAPRGTAVTLDARRSNDFVRISTSDAGPGIPPDHLEKIFLPYWRAYKEPRQRGTGLGLAIAKAIVEAHQGRIWVESRVGSGSVFHVELPVQQTQAPAAED